MPCDCSGLSWGCRRGRARRRRCRPAPGRACSAPAARSGCAASRAVALRQRQAQLVALRRIEAPHQVRQRRDHAAAVVHRRVAAVAGRADRLDAQPGIGRPVARRIPLVLQVEGRRRVRADMSMPVAPSCSRPSSQRRVVSRRLRAFRSPAADQVVAAAQAVQQLARERPGAVADAGVVAHVEHRRGVGRTGAASSRIAGKRPAPLRSSMRVSSPMRRVSCRFRRAMSNEDELSRRRAWHRAWPARRLSPPACLRSPRACPCIRKGCSVNCSPGPSRHCTREEALIRRLTPMARPRRAGPASPRRCRCRRRWCVVVSVRSWFSLALMLRLKLPPSPPSPNTPSRESESCGESRPRSRLSAGRSSVLRLRSGSRRMMLMVPAMARVPVSAVGAQELDALDHVGRDL